MKSLLFLSFLPLAFTSSDLPSNPSFDPKQPIYLGQSFYPPTMQFMAWQPTPLKPINEWCTQSADCTDHRIFSLGGIEGLQIHDYFEKAAYLTRLGRRFADCVVTPESVRMGACESAERFPGPGMRKWSCWVNGEELDRSVEEKRETPLMETEEEQQEEEETSYVTVYETVYRGSSESVPTGTFTS